MRLRAPRAYRRRADGSGIPEQRGATGPSAASPGQGVPEDGDGGTGRRQGKPARRPSRRPGRLVADFGRHAWGVVHAAALAVGLIGALLIGAFLLAQHTSLLGVRHVQVHGASDVAAATITQAAGVTEGMPMTAVDSEVVEQRVMQVPGLESASVQRMWPTTVRITVTERVPVLAVETAAGVILVDRHGVAFDNIVEPPDNLVLFTPPVENAEDAVTAASEAVSALPRKIRAEIETVKATSAHDLRLYLTGGREVVWGDGSEPERKAEVLALLLSVEGSVYDVSVPDVTLVQ